MSVLCESSGQSLSTIKNAVAIVTGATGGIGEALCLAMAERGARLVMIARKAEALTELKDKVAAFGAPVIMQQVDIARREQVRQMRDRVLEEFGNIDILINNAAIGLFQTIGESDEKDISVLLSTNLLGSIYCIQEVLPSMRKQKRGHIVNISSVIGRHASYHQGIYAATKAALDRVSEALLAEEHRHGVVVTLALPDRTDTEFLAHALGPRNLAVLPGGNLRKLSTREVASGIVSAIENNESVHYSSWRGRVFSWLSAASPAIVDRLLGRPNE